MGAIIDREDDPPVRAMRSASTDTPPLPEGDAAEGIAPSEALPESQEPLCGWSAPQTWNPIEGQEETWSDYREVNRQIAQAVVENYQDGDCIWIQHYHLLLLPAYLARKLRTANIGLRRAPMRTCPGEPCLPVACARSPCTPIALHQGRTLHTLARERQQHPMPRRMAQGHDHTARSCCALASPSTHIWQLRRQAGRDYGHAPRRRGVRGGGGALLGCVRASRARATASGAPCPIHPPAHSNCMRASLVVAHHSHGRAIRSCSPHRCPRVHGRGLPARRAAARPPFCLSGRP